MNETTSNKYREIANRINALEKARVNLTEKFMRGREKEPVYEGFMALSKKKARKALQQVHHIEEVLGGVKSKKILDIGCGWGELAILLTLCGAKVIGIDPRKESIAYAQRLADTINVALEWRVGGVETVSIKEEFDLITCIEVIEHIKDKDRLISKISSLLRRGGKLYLTAPNLWSLDNIRSDPHLNIFGLTVLPHSLAKFYVINILKRATVYEVYRFPTRNEIIRLCKRYGLSIVEQNFKKWQDGYGNNLQDFLFKPHHLWRFPARMLYCTGLKDLLNRYLVILHELTTQGMVFTGYKL